MILHSSKFYVLANKICTLQLIGHFRQGFALFNCSAERRAAQCGVTERVRFLGWRDDGPALLAAANAFVCSSRHEPLGNVVLEAWAHDCPVIAVESQGPGALIEHGRTGLLTPIDDSGALARAMSRAIAEPGLRKDLAGAGKDAFRTDFTEDAVVARYLEFFDAVTN